MKKKVIICVLTISFLFHIGCFDPAQISRSEFEAKAPEIKIIVYTVDQKKYEFEEGKYVIRNDTLSGAGIGWQKFAWASKEEQFTFRGSIPMKDVVGVETKELNVGNTIKASAAVLLVVALIIALVSFPKGPIFTKSPIG